MIVVTHSNRKFEPTHTSWAEIEAFSRILQSVVDLIKVSVLDYTSITEVKQDSIEDLIVFWSGKARPQILESVKSAKHVYVVVQDPNWPTYIDVDRKYTLITPFEALINCNGAGAAETIRAIAPNIIFKSFPFRHIYIPLGQMLTEDDIYLSMYTDNLKYNFEKMGNVVYVGSLKNDRLDHMAKLAKEGCHFYGNFSKEKFLEATHLDESEIHPQTKFKGRTSSPYVVPAIYRSYHRIIEIPDQKITKLKVNMIRHAEMALGRSNVITITGKIRREWSTNWLTYLDSCPKREISRILKNEFNETARNNRRQKRNKTKRTVWSF